MGPGGPTPLLSELNLLGRPCGAGWVNKDSGTTFYTGKWKGSNFKNEYKCSLLCRYIDCSPNCPDFSGH